MNFDRLRFVAERAEVGEEREALFAVTIPEERGSFKRFCELIGTLPGGPRNVTEFNYRISDAPQAHVFVGLTTHGKGESTRIAANFTPARLRGAGPHARRTGQGAHPPHGGRPLGAGARRAPAALRVSGAARRADEVPLAHAARTGTSRSSTTATRAPTTAASWWACRCPASDDKAFKTFLDTLGYPYVEETDNPVYRLFLRS